MNGGPQLTFNVQSIGEMFPENDAIDIDRMSFSNGLNDFHQKYKYRVGTYQNVLEKIELPLGSQELEVRVETPRIQERKNIIVPGCSKRLFEVSPPNIRESSPEFFVPQDVIMRRRKKTNPTDLLGRFNQTNEQQK